MIKWDSNTGLCDLKAYALATAFGKLCLPTDSLLASLLRNTSSCLYFLIEAGILLQTGPSLLPLKQKLPFHPSFSFEHPQGIPSAKTLGIGDQQSEDNRTKSF